MNPGETGWLKEYLDFRKKLLNDLTAIIGTAQHTNEHQRKKIEQNAQTCATCPHKAYIGIKLSPYNSKNAHWYKCTKCTCAVAKRILANNCPLNKFIDNG